MSKIIFTLIFTLGISIQLHALNEKPTEWTESEFDYNSKKRANSFLDETRLRCVSDGYKKITGDTPSHSFLAALALRIRTDVSMPGNNEDDSYTLQRSDEQSNKTFTKMRTEYLMWMAQHISISGACVDGEISNSKELTNAEYKSIIAAINQRKKPKSVLDKETKETVLQSPELDKLSLQLTDWKYSNVQKLFPINDENENKFTGLSYDQKKALSIKTFDDQFRRDVGLFETSPTSGKFLNCFEKIEKNRNEGIKNSKGKSVNPSELCQSIQNECGYSESKYFCKGFEQVKPAVTSPKDGPNPKGTSGR